MPQGAMELSRLSDDLLIKILAMASSWPHSRVPLTCARFSRLVPAFRRLAVETFGIDETLMIVSTCIHGSWLLDQERGRWLRCDDPPMSKMAKMLCAAALGHEVMVYGYDRDGSSSTMAFNPELNSWRQLPSPFGHNICGSLITMDYERVSVRPGVFPLLTRAQVVAHSYGRMEFALYDGHAWKPIPTQSFPNLLHLRTCRIATMDGTIYLTDRPIFGFPHTTTYNLYAYDTVAGTWTEREMPEHRGTCDLVLAVAGRLYLCGHLVDGFSLVDIYDLATDSCTTAHFECGNGKYVHFNKKLSLLPPRHPNSPHCPPHEPVAIYEWGKTPGVAQSKSLLPSLPILPSGHVNMCFGIAVNPHR